MQVDLDRAYSLGGVATDGGFAFIEVYTAKWDASETLKFASQNMAAHIQVSSNMQGATPQTAPSLPIRPGIPA